MLWRRTRLRRIADGAELLGHDAEAYAAEQAAEKDEEEAVAEFGVDWALPVGGPDGFPVCAEVYEESWPLVVAECASQIHIASWGTRSNIGGWGVASIDDEWCLFGVTSTTLSHLHSGRSLPLADVPSE